MSEELIKAAADILKIHYHFKFVVSNDGGMNGALYFYKSAAIEDLEENKRGYYDNSYEVVTISYFKDFDPLTNSNHTDMLRDKLVEMGFREMPNIMKEGVQIKVYSPHVEHVNGWHVCENGTYKSINLIRTQAYVEAVRKLK